MNQQVEASHETIKAPPFWASLLLCSLLVGVMGYLRLVLFSDRIFPLAAGLPLLLCLWNRDLRLLYGMAAGYTLIILIKNLVILPAEAAGDIFDSLAIASQLVEVWLVAGVIHGLLRAMAGIRGNNELLYQANHALEARNKELAAHEEEIARQNEELQAQTEEMEQQTEELRQQAEELEQQSADLHETNLELGRREKGMQTLLDSGRWLRSDMNEGLVMNGVCQAAIQVMGDGTHAAAVIENTGGTVHIRGDAGFGLSGAMNPTFGFDGSFTSLVFERGQTGSIEDTQSRPDIELLLPSAGPPFRSVLSAPIWLEGRAVAALEVYSCTPRTWSEHEFCIIEWLAAQAALTLQALRFQHELEVKRTDAEEASIQKSRFLAAVSHDVRTPANAISLLSELIERMSEDPAQQHQVPEMAKKLGSSARALIDLVSDVLDLTRFDSGRMELQVSEFSLSSLIMAEIKQSQPIAENKGLVLTHDPGPMDVRLRTDRMKLARVLSNLIGNAVKFTERGQIGIRYEGSGREPIRLIVSDTGPGIASDHLPRIFDEFFQIMNPERDREKGTGLGLAICRRLLDGLGCEVAVDSSPGMGTTFTITIPLELIAEGTPSADGHLSESVNGPLAAAADGGSHRTQSLLGLRILLVEDHDITRRSMAHLLADHGATVTEARTGREALDSIACNSHQILLLDLNLPDIDGSEILRSLQSMQGHSLKCVLVLSGDVRPERIAEVRLLGATDMIPKPLRVERVVEVIGKVFAN